MFGVDLPQCRFKWEDDVTSGIACSCECIAVACCNTIPGAGYAFCSYGNVSARHGQFDRKERYRLTEPKRFAQSAHADSTQRRLLAA